MEHEPLKLKQLFSKIKFLILDCLFPIFCYGCEKEGSYICETCRAALQFLPPSCIICTKIVFSQKKNPPGKTCRACRSHTYVDTFCSPFLFKNSLIRTLIHDFKYRRARFLAPFFAELFFEYMRYYRITLPERAILVPIPLSYKRERLRGFNQSLLVVEHLAKLLSSEYALDALGKAKETKPQAGLLGEERHENVRGVFYAKKLDKISGRVVVLFDDVKTTGATLEEAAQILREAGAQKIWVFTIAH